VMRREEGRVGKTMSRSLGLMGMNDQLRSQAPSAQTKAKWKKLLRSGSIQRRSSKSRHRPGRKPYATPFVPCLQLQTAQIAQALVLLTNGVLSSGGFTPPSPAIVEPPVPSLLLLALRWLR
jgi:hypothetical protein